MGGWGNGWMDGWMDGGMDGGKHQMSCSDSHPGIHSSRFGSPLFVCALMAACLSSFPMQIERNLGLQPIAAILEGHALRHHDLVASSSEQITHKMVARACKGRRLTSNVKVKLRDALNGATGSEYTISDLFTY